MTRVVALDTSSAWGGVALLQKTESKSGAKVVAEAVFSRDGAHGTQVLMLLDALMIEAGWSRSSVDLYAATRGPGTFTGLRVGLGTLRGLGLASCRPCLGIGTLDAMAEGLGASGADRVPLLDAGRGEVYGARFDPSSSPPLPRVAPWVGPPEGALLGGPMPLIFGPGADLHALRLRERGALVAPREGPVPVAAAAGRLALLEWEAGVPDGDGLSPLYLRPAYAELKAW